MSARPRGAVRGRDRTRWTPPKKRPRSAAPHRVLRARRRALQQRRLHRHRLTKWLPRSHRVGALDARETDGIDKILARAPVA